MKFRALFISTFILLNTLTVANALNKSDISFVDTILAKLIENSENFSNVPNAKSAINNAILNIQKNAAIGDDNKDNAIKLLLLNLRPVVHDITILNAAIIASNASTTVKTTLINTRIDTPDGAKPIVNSP